MGPGHLAVERYLGPCLISHRKPKKPPDSQQQDKRYYGGWTGVPLISLQASPRRPVKKEQDRSPLSRLAIHTQGAPLILSNGNYGRKNHGKPVRIVLPSSPPNPGSSPPASSASSDTQSVASDESHSESSLPRIIKPRKRRKKERKPPPQEPVSTNSSSIVTLQPYVPLCYEFDKFRQRSKQNKPAANKEKPEETVDVLENFVLPVPVDIKDEHDTVCQCEYCDPVSQIWDFGRRCFSPAMGGSRLSSLPVLRPCAAEFPWYLPPHEGLKRSQSEPVPPPPSTPKPTTPSRPLEVTSEIVTAHDGHRDIEIRFFLPPREE